MDRPALNFKWILILLMAIGIGVVFWTFLSSGLNQNSTRVPLPKAAVKSLMALTKIRQTATKDGIVQWKLEATTAELEAETGKMILQSPHILFFLDDGGKVQMTAAQGVLNTNNNNMEVQGNVRLQNDRYTLVTEQLVYRHDVRIITTRTPVVIRSTAIQLKAATMTYNLDTNQAEFNGPVEGIIYENPVS